MSVFTFIWYASCAVVEDKSPVEVLARKISYIYWTDYLDPIHGQAHQQRSGGIGSGEGNGSNEDVGGGVELGLGGGEIGNTLE